MNKQTILIAGGAVVAALLLSRYLGKGATDSTNGNQAAGPRLPSLPSLPPLPAISGAAPNMPDMPKMPSMPQMPRGLSW